jgi:hypothetical protein
MLHKVKNAKLRISESIQFYGDVLNICEQNNPTELNIQKQWSNLERSFQLLNQSFKQEQTSLRTAVLASLDERRDNAIVCLRKLADGFTNHHDTHKQKAGEQLLITIDKYGRQISKMNYQAETSVLDNLVVDLKNESDGAAAVKTLGLTDIVEEIEATNDLFNKTYLERVGEDAEKVLKAAGDLVRECSEKYHVLARHIEANAIINPSEASNELINQLNTLIDKFNILLVQRSRRGTDDVKEVL